MSIPHILAGLAPLAGQAGDVGGPAVLGGSAIAAAGIDIPEINDMNTNKENEDEDVTFDLDAINNLAPDDTNEIKSHTQHSAENFIDYDETIAENIIMVEDASEMMMADQTDQAVAKVDVPEMALVEVSDQAVAKVDAPEMALVEVADQAVAKVDAWSK